jgi:hypothetical protein
MTDGTRPARPRPAPGMVLATVMTSAAVNNSTITLTLRGTGMSPHSPHFQSAQRARKTYLPGGGS